MQGFPILSFLTWLPIAGGLVVLAFGDRGIKAGRWVALSIAVATFIASIPLYTNFNVASFDFQLTEHLPWIPAFHATYSLGVIPKTCRPYSMSSCVSSRCECRRTP